MKIEVGDSKIELEGNHWLWIILICLCFGWESLLIVGVIVGGLVLYKDEKARRKVFGWLYPVHDRTTGPLIRRIRKKLGIKEEPQGIRWEDPKHGHYIWSAYKGRKRIGRISYFEDIFIFRSDETGHSERFWEIGDAKAWVEKEYQ